LAADGPIFTERIPGIRGARSQRTPSISTFSPSG